MYCNSLARNLRARSAAILCGAVLACTVSASALGATIFESGTLGPVDFTWQQAIEGEVPATSVSQVVFTGVRFELNQQVTTNQIGGHFVAAVSGTFFGAIVDLESEDDFPDSDDLSTQDVLGDTLLTFPVRSAEVFGGLTISLNPGWYALFFGSGLFGATGNGGTVRNGTDIGDPTYIGFQPGVGWFNSAALPSSWNNNRFVISGNIIPEPTAIWLAMLTSFTLVVPNRIKRCRP